MRAALAVAVAALCSCAEASTLPAATNKTIDPSRFFEGRTRGDGVLHKLVGGSVKVTVDSNGRLDRNGVLILDQTIREGAKPPRQRRWVMRPLGGGRYTGTLSDATGPVSVVTHGGRATIHYRMKGGLDVEQKLALQADGRTILNSLAVKKFGVRLARLEEVIRKLD